MADDDVLPPTIGRYRIVRQLGAGGMGVVYEARDDKLDRAVALKVIRDDQCDGDARKRFWREARAAASISHPNVCQLFEIDEDGPRLYLTMELLQGEALGERIRRGAIPVAEAAEIALGILAAVGALHARGIVHRDLKPSNVFLTPSGVKLLDFGLARPMAAADDLTRTEVTHPGAIVGTPHYMPPEQIQGLAVDERSDLFAAAAILFEMLTGQRPFGGKTMVEVFHAVLYEAPPVVGGSAAAAALGRVVRRGLAKEPRERPASATDMAQEIRGALAVPDSGTEALPRAHAVTRLVVLPFRMLRPDADLDFLTAALPDAITTSLSGLGSLVVRSSLAAARFATEAPDLKVIAEAVDVDVVLTGTLLRGGDQVRVAAQLVEAPGGTVLWSQTSQVRLQDIFQLQDDIVGRIVESLSLPLTAREHRMLRHDVPATPRAYEFYLRANPLSLDSATWEAARDLYEQCVTEDPRYAPGWARLGRIYRLLAKFRSDDAPKNVERAEAAFAKALVLNPDLPLAHSLYAQFESESGRPEEALRRLLRLARTATSNAEVHAGLVHACRYAGLLEASVAAHRQARALDPNIRTSVAYTYLMLGDLEAAAALPELGTLTFERVYLLSYQGRVAEALGVCREAEAVARDVDRHVLAAYRNGAEGRKDDCLAAVALISRSSFRDPEGLYFMARVLVMVQELAHALEVLGRVVDGGFYCDFALGRDPGFDALRGEAAFQEIVARAARRRKAAESVFIEAGGEAILGVTAAAR